MTMPSIIGDEEFFMHTWAEAGDAVVEAAYIAARAEGFFATAACNNGINVCVVRPLIKQFPHSMQHPERERVKRLRAIQREVCDVVTDLDEDVVVG